MTGICLAIWNVHPHDTRDELGRDRCEPHPEQKPNPETSWAATGANLTVARGITVALALNGRKRGSTAHS